jgi:RNA polymerase sigma-70 factor (ECF subfamily)
MRHERPAPSDGDFDQLIQAARAGSREALGQLLEASRRYLLRLGVDEIGPLLQRKAGASDLVQDTFLDAQRAFRDFRGATEGEVRAWLRQIFLRNLLSFRRHYQARSKRQVAREVSLDGGGQGVRFRDGLETNALPPDVQVARSEENRLMRTALLGLPSTYRQVVHLRTRERLQFDAIGERLGCSGEAARKL